MGWNYLFIHYLFFKLKVLFSCSVFLRYPPKVSGWKCLTTSRQQKNQEFSSDRLCPTENSACRQSWPTGRLSRAGTKQPIHTRAAEYHSLCLQHKTETEHKICFQELSRKKWCIRMFPILGSLETDFRKEVKILGNNLKNHKLSVIQF